MATHRAARRVVTVLAVAVPIGALIAGPAGASTRGGQIPTGNSAANQYLEVIPTAGGAREATSVAPVGGPVTTAVSPSTARVLATAGQLGRTAVALARATAPPSERTRGVRAGAGRPTAAGRAGTETAGGPGTTHGGLDATRVPSPASELARALAGAAGGLGVVLPVILGATALVAVALLARRWHSRP